MLDAVRSVDLLKAAANLGIIAFLSWSEPVAKGPVEQEKISSVVGAANCREPSESTFPDVLPDTIPNPAWVLTVRGFELKRLKH